MLIFCFVTPVESYGKKADTEPILSATREGYPPKFTDAYLKVIKKEYRKVTKDENVVVALDMMKDTTADFSRSAILGYNLTEKPIKVSFKDLATIDEQYASFDALGWKKGSRLYIYINNCHYDAPPAALAALLSHDIRTNTILLLKKLTLGQWKLPYGAKCASFIQRKLIFLIL